MRRSTAVSELLRVAEFTASQFNDLIYSAVVHLAEQPIIGSCRTGVRGLRPSQQTTETDSLAALQTLDAESFARAQAH